MKMFIALGLLVLSFNVTAHDQAPHKIKCVAKGYAGDSVTLAISSCKEVGNYIERNCAKTVSCTHYMSFCTAKGYAGDNVADAVKRCNELGNQSQRNCLRSVSCR